MSEQLLGLTHRPFSSIPNVKNYFPAQGIHHAFSQTRMAVERSAGHTIICGPAGTGKSLLLALVAEQFRAKLQIVNVICNDRMERRDLLQNILFELQLPYRERSEGELRLGLIDYLKTDPRAAAGVLLLVDDADSLTPQLLDELRLITNFNRDGRGLVSLVLTGDSGLEELLIDARSESFNQRICARCYLTNLSQSETIEYIVAHVDRAGGCGERLFTSDALKTVFRASDGCPRVINQICDYALVLAASQNSGRVTAEIVAEAWNDVQAIPDQADLSAQNAEIPDTIKSLAAAPQHLTTGSMIIEFGELDEQSLNTGSTAASSDSAAVYYELQIDDSECTGCTTDDSHRSSSTESNQRGESTYENPFAGLFESEETVRASFFPACSEHNLNSLSLTMSQLSVLDQIPKRGPIETATGQVRLPGPTISTVHSPQRDQMASGIAKEQIDEVIGQIVEREPDLRVSPRNMRDLNAIEAEITRLQRQDMLSRSDLLHFAGQTIQLAAAEPIPPREWTHTHTIVADQQPPTPNPGVIFDDDQRSSFDRPVTPEYHDDKDILVVRPTERRGPTSESEKETEFLKPRISTGRGKRMDYSELFKQLRSAD